MPLKVTSAGNAGVFIQADGLNVYIDAFFHPVLHVGGPAALKGADAEKADLILITHEHYDHIHPEEVQAAALASGALVAGPARAIQLLEHLLPADRLVVLEPAERKRPPDRQKTAIRGIDVTAYRTYHGRGHNSYLLEIGQYRVFHDADNERTQPYDVEELGRIDVLLLCPWAGSGAGDFVARLNPGKWLLIHMTEEEIDQHRNGSFLPALISPVPPGVVALRGGESLEM